MAEEGEFDIAQLTQDQQLALQQFTSVTDQELAKAVPLLQKCEWNVQIAIARFFDGEPVASEDPTYAPPPPQSSRTHDTLANGFNRNPASTSRSSSASSRRQLDPAPPISPNFSSNLIRTPPLFVSIILAPANLIYRLLARVFNLLAYFFPFLPRLLARLTSSRQTGTATAGSNTTAPTTGRRPLGPQDTTLRFLREFSEDYGQHSLPFLETGYSRAFDLAKRELKFLLVVPLAPEHDRTGPFVRNVLLSDQVSAYLNDPDKQTYLWAGTIQDSEPFQVAESLSITQFPAAALIALKPSVSSTSMSVVTRLADPEVTSSPTEFIARLEAAATQHAPELQRARSTRDEREATRNLREQQNTAYERSLARDRERARQKRDEEAARARQEEQQREEQEAQARHQQNLHQWKLWRASRIPAEPSQSSDGAKDSVRISLRLLGGERITRRLPADAAIEDIYALVECWDILNEPSALHDAAAQPPAGFVHKYGFRLVSPMPREVYDLESGGPLHQRIGRSANLIVERIEEDDEDSASEK